MSQWSPPTHTKHGYSYELEARKSADRLTASGEPYGFLVAAARDCLRSGTPPRDAAVIAGAKRYRKEQIDAINRNRARRGEPPIAWNDDPRSYA